MSAATTAPAGKRTQLFDEHVSLGAKIVPFAGYDMPVQYPLGVLKEHLWTREKAGLFDVSHMGQARLVAADGHHDTVAAALETLVPADITNLAPGRQRYTQLLNDDGGIIDDLMVVRPAGPDQAGQLLLVVNAARKDVDYARMRDRLPAHVSLETTDNKALLALQGPAAVAVLGQWCPAAAANMPFMSALATDIDGIAANVTRSGYTGEDGYEISVAGADAVKLWSKLLGDERVQPIGLGARDSLRLEAGLCLYGHDIDETTSPVEAGLLWSIQRRRREEGGFPGANRIQREIAEGPKRLRVGLRPEGRAPAREGADIMSRAGEPVGGVTSGGFGPSVNGPVAMGYVSAPHASVGTELDLIVRGKPLAARTVELPFHPHRFVRKSG